MKITRLRLSGFKSFVEPTELHIEPGLTGIVGPNGCGKSNLLEALRWAMGESSPKSMRGGAMDDVIFAGTSNRPARNMAEVTVFLDNADHRAPSAFNAAEAIEVTRRIEREAGSAYRVNGGEVRQRDVQILFADASTGAHSPALVKQGQIGQLINAKPIARRAILEEAAGISGLHSRRHEAELRLRAAETNLTRLNDVIQELETQLTALKRQARQASRYRNLSGHIRRAEAIAYHLRWTAAAEAVALAETHLATSETLVGEATSRAATASTGQANAQADLPALREAEAARAAALHRLKLERENLDAEERRARDAAAKLDSLINDLGSDIMREEERVADADSVIARLDEEGATIEGGRDARVEHDEAATSHVEATLAALLASEQSLDAQQAEAARLAARRQSLERALGESRARLNRLQQQIEANASARAIASEEASQAPDVTRAADEAESARRAAEAAMVLAEEADTLRSEAAHSEFVAREPLALAERDAARIRAEAKVLADLLNANSNDLWPPLIDAVKVAAGYEAALAAALGDDLDAPLDEAAPIHWRTLEALAETPALPEGATPLSAVVDAPDALGRRLALIGLVDAADGARLQAQLVPGQRLVSMDGALWRWDGFSAAADAQTPAALRLAQRNRLTDLASDIATAERAASDVRAVYHAVREAAEKAAADERELRNEARAAETRLADALNALARAEREAAQHSSRLATLDEAARRLADENDEASIVLADAEAGLADLTGEQDLAAEIVTLRERVASERLAAGEARAALDTLKREHEAADRRLKTIAHERADWAKRGQQAQTQIASLAHRRDAATSELEQLKSIPVAIEAKRTKLLDLIGDAEAARDVAADALARGEELLADADREAKAANAALASSREDRARTEALLDGARMRLAETAQRVREAMECLPTEMLARAELGEGDELPTLEQIDAKVDRLKRERETLGGVNLRAEEEAQDYEQRLASMQAEKADLEGAIARLRAGIGSLNREGRERLLGAFETVNANFRRLFTSLFGGGEAHLTLTESDDPLEAGLEIFARPPGKRLTTLSLLSGGEQALTALSLIFAIFLSNPSPICVLDEVDAPLDDANVERFCNLMDEMTRQTETRFLVITHHATTMSRMHRLFGVTMMERGVSQLVSVDLAGAERVLAAE